MGPIATQCRHHFRPRAPAFMERQRRWYMLPAHCTPPPPQEDRLAGGGTPDAAAGPWLVWRFEQRASEEPLINPDALIRQVRISRHTTPRRFQREGSRLNHSDGSDPHRKLRLEALQGLRRPGSDRPRRDTPHFAHQLPGDTRLMRLRPDGPWRPRRLSLEILGTPTCRADAARTLRPQSALTPWPDPAA